LVLPFAGLMFAGCEPTCQIACRRFLDCDLETPGVTLDECEASCVFQEDKLEAEEDDVGRQRFSDHKRCVARSSCEEVADGACYDEELFPFSAAE
jgi:hypothetical protein